MAFQRERLFEAVDSLLRPRSRPQFQPIFKVFMVISPWTPNKISY